MGEDERQNEQFFVRVIVLFIYFCYEAVIETSACKM